MSMWSQPNFKVCRSKASNIFCFSLVPRCIACPCHHSAVLVPHPLPSLSMLSPPRPCPCCRTSPSIRAIARCPFVHARRPSPSSIAVAPRPRPCCGMSPLVCAVARRPLSMPSRVGLSPSSTSRSTLRPRLLCIHPLPSPHPLLSPSTLVCLASALRFCLPSPPSPRRPPSTLVHLTIPLPGSATAVADFESVAIPRRLCSSSTQTLPPRAGSSSPGYVCAAAHLGARYDAVCSLVWVWVQMLYRVSHPPPCPGPPHANAPQFGWM